MYQYIEGKTMYQSGKDHRRSALRSGIAIAAAIAAGAVNAAQLEEVVVTAQKREQALIDVPLSVGTLSEENLDIILSSGVDVLALTGRVPSLYVESSNGRIAPRFYIRGLGNTAFDANAAQPVSIVYDDVVLENVSVKAFPLFDIDSVEVLRGPQGTLFGRNTPAGVVKFESRRPTEEATGYVDASYGRYDFRNIEAAWGGPVSDTVAMRASVFYNGREDWIDNVAPGFEDNNAFGGFEEAAGRLQLRWTPSDQTSVLLSGGYHNQFQGSQTGFRAGLIQIGEGFTGVDRETISWDSLERSVSELEQYYLTARVDHSFDDLTLTSITGYRSIIENKNQGDVDGGSLTGPFFPGNVPFLRDVLGFGENWALETGDNIVDHEQITQEFRLASDTGGPFDWLVGLYYFYEDVAIDQLNATSFPAFGAPPLAIPTVIARQFQETNGWAAFASFDYAFSERLTGKAGIRYSSDDKEHVFACTPDNGNTPFPCPTSIDTDVDDSAVTGDLSLTYALNENANAYARISRGYNRHQE
jgi:iron complex outermembrane receptor protein